MLSWRDRVIELGKSFSFIGLVFAGIFFAGSVTPSLLPRAFVFQGLLSGFAIAVGYGVGVAIEMLLGFLEIPPPPEKYRGKLKVLVSVLVAATFVLFLRQMTIWQNSLRALMEMEPVESAYPTSTAVVAILFGVVAVITFRALSYCRARVADRLRQYVPRRVAYGLSATVVGVTLFFIGNGLVARGLLAAAEAFFLRADEFIDEKIAQPRSASDCGSAESLVEWESIGRRGKDFLVGGATKGELDEFWGRETMEPIRVYVGLRTEESRQSRALMAVEELKRVGGFDRKVLIIATPTGTGWLDPGGVDTIEYMHGGDTAIVSMQYSYLPSWLTILVDPKRSIESATALFDAVHRHWMTLPEETRPKLYLHGLSLGALGSEVSAPWYAILDDPPQGAVWSGPPFPSTSWATLTRGRNRTSPAWLPEFRDGSVVRFTSQRSTLDRGQRWGPLRLVYIQYASDPMVFFSPSMLYSKPEWLIGPRGPDVSPDLHWYPLVTFLKVAFDLPMATSIPVGYGHNYHARNYIEAWRAVTDPPGWDAAASERLIQRLANLKSAKP